jgi:putative membrane protein
MRKQILAIGILLATAATAVADTVPEATKTFIEKAAVANQFEIDTSQLALKYGKEADVKTFAQQMIDDHTKAGQEFKASLAEAKLEAPKDGLDITHTAKYAKLRVFTTESGFDSAYVDEQLSAHKDAVGLFKDYSTNGPDGPVKSFAQKTLPTLEHHLMMVESLHDKMNAKSGATGASSGATGTTGDVKQ